MKTLRIIVAPFRRNGSGMTTYSEYLVRALCTVGVEVTVVGFGPEPAFAQSLGIHYIGLGDDPEFLNYMGGPALTYLHIKRKIAKTLQPLIANAEIVNFIYPGATTHFERIKTVTTAWGFVPPLESVRDLKLNVSPKLYPLAAINAIEHYFMDRAAYKMSDAIIGTTSKTIRFWQRRIEGLQGKYIPVPVEYQPFDFHNIEIKSNEKVSFLIGERDLERPRNNVIQCLAAFEILYRKGLNNFQLNLVGHAGEKITSEICRLKKLGVDIKLYEYMKKESFYPLLEQNDVALIPRYIKDQGGYWPIEAMARGNCVIATKSPAFEDFVIDKQNGVLLDSPLPNNIAVAVEKILTDYDFLNKLKKGAVAQIEKEHSLVASGSTYLEYYQYILENFGDV